MSAHPHPFADEAGWLDGSEGFRVDAPGGRLGYVSEIRRDAESGEAQAIVVRAGMLGGHRLVVPVDEIAGVLPSKRLVVLQEPPA